ncbi:hypothetical protein [Chitinophaga barathri]|uniref:DUF2244 domain-containing protein n=1 Tax=Chitinophaga barathri TaxID=1647451 RepID=A0A3N4MGW1_9BACT|nr:hypothetical protein [Chitinophaga barathri]RPD42665.1 hypothetical protein EG028_05730 [Chitinophaga barathri]
MTNATYEIKVPPRRSYKHVRQEVWLVTFIVALIPVGLPLVFGAWQGTILMGAIVLGFASMILQWSQYYITHLRITAEQVEIRYLKKGEEKYITDRPEYFEFSYQTWTNSNEGMMYKLKVHYKGKLILQQYPTSDWAGQKVEETVQFFNYHFPATG